MSRWVVVVAASCSGCGRIDFDPARDGAGMSAWTLVTYASAQCGGPTATCTVTLPVATRSDTLLVAISTANTIQVGPGSIASVAGGGSWVYEPSCFATMLDYGVIDCAYAVASVAGATTITINYSGEGNHVQAEVLEYEYPGATLALDNVGVVMRGDTANPQGVALALSGGDDVVVEALSYNDTITAIGLPYDSPADFRDDGGNAIGVGGALGVVTASQPTWSAAFGSGQALAIAFKAN
jgi:hypothetical protein